MSETRLSLSEVSRLTGVPRRTLWGWVRPPDGSGRDRHHPELRGGLDGRSWAIPLSSLPMVEQLWRERRVSRSSRPRCPTCGAMLPRERRD